MVVQLASCSFTKSYILLREISGIHPRQLPHGWTMGPSETIFMGSHHKTWPRKPGLLRTPTLVGAETCNDPNNNQLLSNLAAVFSREFWTFPPKNRGKSSHPTQVPKSTRLATRRPGHDARRAHHGAKSGHGFGHQLPSSWAAALQDLSSHGTCGSTIRFQP